MKNSKPCSIPPHDQFPLSQTNDFYLLAISSIIYLYMFS